jgi:hypothetical protein
VGFAGLLGVLGKHETVFTIACWALIVVGAYFMIAPITGWLPLPGWRRAQPPPPPPLPPPVSNAEKRRRSVRAINEGAKEFDEEEKRYGGLG